MRRLAALLCLLAALLSACGRTSVGLRMAGSTSLQILTDILAEEYQKAGGPRVSMQGFGSTAGLIAVRDGVAEMAALSRSLTPEEEAEGFRAHVIGYDVLAVVVHPSNPVDNLTREQLRRIYAGEIKDWAELGSPAGPVIVISREVGSGSHDAFRELVGPAHRGALVQNANGFVLLGVENLPPAIGYVSLPVVRRGKAKPIRVEGLLPGEPGYPLVRPLLFATRGEPAGEARRFLEYVLSPAGQRIVQQEGMLPVR